MGFINVDELKKWAQDSENTQLSGLIDTKVVKRFDFQRGYAGQSFSRVYGGRY